MLSLYIKCFIYILIYIHSHIYIHICIPVCVYFSLSHYSVRHIFLPPLYVQNTVIAALVVHPIPHSWYWVAEPLLLTTIPYNF